MNKKFTFMVAALLAAGGFSVNAQTAATGALNQDTYYLIGDGTNGYLKATTVTIEKTGKEFTVLSETGLPQDFKSSTEEDINKSLWKVEVVLKNGKIDSYKLKNKATEAYLTLNDAGTIPTADDESNPTITNFNWFTDSNNDGKIEDISGGTQELSAGAKLLMTTNGIKLSADAATSLPEATYVDPLKLYTINSYTDQAKLVTELNANMGGNGFSLIPSNKDVTVEDENNIFSNQVKAFHIASPVTDNVTGETIPSGVYMIVSAPDKFEESWGKASEAEDQIALFNECEFVAVSASENYGTSEVSENGLQFVVKSGAELNKYSQAADSDKKTSDTEVWVNNAVFNIVEPNQYVNPGSYTFHIAEARIIDSSKTDKSHKNVKNLNVGVTTIQNVNYVTTTATATEFKAGSTSLVKAIDLLKEEKAPSVFNIQFVSGEDTENSEYGKHLGVAATSNNYMFVAQGDALVDLSLPQYQFVISKIDTKTQEVTFTNIETKEDFATKLYATDTDNVYKLVDANVDAKVRVAEDDAKGLAQYASATEMGGMLVKLTPVEVDPYAGFVKLDLNNNTPYKLSFAKNDASSNKLYVAVNPEEGQETKTILSDESALQVVFEPVTANGKIKENEIAIAYAYSKEDKYYTASEDMTVYYTYRMRVVDSQDEQYLKVSSSSPYTLELANTGDEFVVKNLYNGAVAIDNSKTLAANKSKLVANVEAEKAEFTGATYAVPEADELSLFLEAEKLGVSLDAKPVHVSFESENGGFMNVNEANEGVIAIATEASEDLTFWLDTTNSEAFIPSFYISKGGKFMYNSNDSLKVNTPAAKAKYGVGKNGEMPKAIFKAGTLVNPDTLSTTVDGKEVMVAAKANQNKGVLAGIENFQYNIVKASEAEDNYVVRNANGTAYLTNFNGVLGFIADKDNAMRVIVEKQDAPTSNENVAASEVKVIANNGSINVKNAAGKNVVVSTILGQVVANEVLTSDNATINVPAGIVVVSVEGESFKVNVK